MILFIDFDSTVHDDKNPVEGRKMGLPIAGAKEALEKFLTQGHQIVIFTARAKDEYSKKVVSDWMYFYNIPFHDITNIKRNADYYIDDKAIHFEKWEDINI
jgi:hypothetical protein